MTSATEIQPPFSEEHENQDRVHKNDQNEFLQKLEKNDFLGAFMSAIKDAIQLENVTVVEERDQDLVKTLNESKDKGKGKAKKYKGDKGKRIYTKIDLLDGDITNIIGSEFLKDEEDGRLIDFHKEQLEKGQEIIKKIWKP